MRAALVLGFAALANGHSWIHCTDYRGDVGTYDSSLCFGHPRPKNNNFPDAGAFGVDQGFDTQNAVCQSTQTNSAQFPMATYQRGATVTLAWPSKNHVAATCTNSFIPDTSTKLFVGPDATGTTPNEAGFSQVSASFSDDPHVNGVIDFKGFQNCPNFCDNTDKSLCTGTFTVPADLTDGTYTFQWSWVFNQGASPYTSCFEAQIAGDSTGPTPVQNPTGPPVTPAPTTAAEANCGAMGSQCDGALFNGVGCCQNGLSCLRESQWFSQCLSTCPIDWECSETASCVAKGEQCGGEYHDGSTCCSSGSCYVNSPYYSQCRDDCPIGWECDTAAGFSFGMGRGGINFALGFLMMFLILSGAVFGVLYGRCWERQAAQKALDSEGPAFKDAPSVGGIERQEVELGSQKRRSTLNMPPAAAKPLRTPPPRPPVPAARKPPAFYPQKRHVEVV